MGNLSTRFTNFFSTNHILDEETIATYVELTYLNKNEVRRVINLLDNVNPGKLRQNPHHRFTIEEIETILPQLRCSPFRDSIYRVFSSKKDGRLSLEDVLDLCSAFSEYCPDNVRATWAFYVFDLNGDGEISSNDLIETVQRLMWPHQNECIDTAEAEHVARIIFRHGDRTPSKLEIYPTAPYNPIYESLGYGQLTDKGKIREFQLGTLLRTKYSKFLGGHHTYGSVYAYSSDVDRTKMSLQLVLAGIYPPTIDEEGSIRLSPIPAYYVPNIVDSLLFPSLCPKYQKEYFKVSNLPLIRKEILKNKDLLNYLEEYTGLNMTTNPLLQIYKLHHFLMSQISMNIALPEWATENVRHRIEKLVALEYNILSFNTLMKRLNGGFIIKEFIKNLNKSNNTSNPKIYVYSGHELNIAAFAKAHDLIEPKLPAFGSAIIVEKLRNHCGEVYIQMHLWTGVTEQLITYKIPKCEKICPYNKYLKLIEHVIPCDEEINCLWNNISMNTLQAYYHGDKTISIYNILS